MTTEVTVGYAYGRRGTRRPALDSRRSCLDGDEERSPSARRGVTARVTLEVTWVADWIAEISRSFSWAPAGPLAAAAAEPSALLFRMTCTQAPGGTASPIPIPKARDWFPGRL